MSRKKQKPAQNDPEVMDDADFDPEAAALDPEEVVAHEDALAELEQQVGEWQERCRRALADYDNFRRRSLANEQEAHRQGVISVVSKLLGLADNVDRALDVDVTTATIEQIHQGVAVIRDELRQVLAAHAVSRIEPARGEEFDPERHQALMQIPSPDVEPGHVVMTLQVGYLMGDRTLRPAKVSVAAGPSAESDKSEGE